MSGRAGRVAGSESDDGIPETKVTVRPRRTGLRLTLSAYLTDACLALKRVGAHLIVGRVRPVACLPPATTAERP